MPPRICIVTPSYNQGAFLEETIQSVLIQDYPNLQYIVVDGGSTDNSVEVIKKYASRIDYWESGKDRGQSHAINKGLARCAGEIFNWINSDDLLMPGALWAVAEAWLQKPGSIISGRTEIFDESGTLETAGAAGQTLRNFIRFWEAEEFAWTQQGTFLPLQKLRDIGGVSEDLHFCMDYEMMVKLLAGGIDVQYLDRTLSRFRVHQLSKTLGAKKDFRLEKVDCLKRLPNLPVAVEPWEWNAEQGRRLIDMAIHAWRGNSRLRAASLFRRSLVTSPRAAAAEVFRRACKKLRHPSSADRRAAA